MKTKQLTILILIALLPAGCYTIISHSPPREPAPDEIEEIIIVDDLEAIHISNSKVVIHSRRIYENRLSLVMNDSGIYRLYGISGQSAQDSTEADIYVYHLVKRGPIDKRYRPPVKYYFDLTPMRESYIEQFNYQGPILIRLHIQRHGTGHPVMEFYLI